MQYIDAHSARQKLYKEDDGSIFGVYTITETVPTIIPFTPCIAYENTDTVKNSDISQWLIGLVVIDGDPNDPGSYSVYKYIEHKKFVKRRCFYIMGIICIKKEVRRPWHCTSRRRNTSAHA